MRLYCVRHGESRFNALRLHQHEKVELSETGVKQARYVAKHFAKITLDAIVASDFERAKQTAEIINEIVKKQILFEPLLRELKRPTEIEGKPYDDPKVVKIRQLIRKNRNDENWHHSDEENFFDFRTRIENFVRDVSKRTEKNILIVTHAEVIRMILSVIMFQSIVTPEVFQQFEEYFKLNNTGITVLEKRESGKWQLRTWNDHAHLG